MPLIPSTTMTFLFLPAVFFWAFIRGMHRFAIASSPSRSLNSFATLPAFLSFNGRPRFHNSPLITSPIVITGMSNSFATDAASVFPAAGAPTNANTNIGISRAATSPPLPSQAFALLLHKICLQHRVNPLYSPHHRIKGEK